MSTVKDVAKLAGVSPSTVSRTLSNRIFVEEETRQKVLKAVEALNYKPNIMARGLKEGKTQTLALLVPDINSLYYPMIMKSVEKWAVRKDYSIFLCNNNEDIEQEKRNLNMFRERCVDGVLCMSVQDDVCHLVRLQQEDKIPVVLINRYFDEDINCVTVDNRHGGYLMMKHLLEQGHRKIAGVFGNIGIQRYRERYEGCKQAMMEYGVEDYKRYFIYDVDTIDETYQRTVEMLKREDRPTAFFASIDLMTVGIYSGISQCGMRIPEDISVAGYDNIFITQYMTPPLTTYDAPVDELARESVECLIRKIENKMEGPAEKKVLRGSLIERGSVAKIGRDEVE